MINADFHIHTSFSSDSSLSPESLISKCIKTGLNCIAVTDHNTIEGALKVADIAPFKVIIGSEVKSAQGEIIGLFLKEDIPSNKTALETVKLIKEQNGLVSVPHPFDRYRKNVITKDGLESIIPYIDMLEVFNARNIRDMDNQKAMAFAVKNNLPICGVTDSHSIIEVGSTYTRMPDFLDNIQAFKQALSEATIISKKSHPFVHGISTYNKIKKRIVNTLRSI
jgi:hypothetical protein